MISSLIFSLIGFCVGLRTIESFIEMGFVEGKHKLKHQIVIILAIFIAVLCLVDHSLLLWQGLIVIFLSPQLAILAIILFRERKIEEQIVSILDFLILSMSGGRSFRSSFEKYISVQKGYLKIILEDFYKVMCFQIACKTSLRSVKTRFFLEELLEIDRSGHKQLERLKCLRRRLAIEKTFRRKSRQATTQVRAQAVLMTVMYVFLSIYVCSEFGWQRICVLWATASFIFLIGLFLVLTMGRNYQWKL